MSITLYAVVIAFALATSALTEEDKKRPSSRLTLHAWRLSNVSALHRNIPSLNRILLEAKARIEFEKKIGKPSVAVGDAAYLEWLQKTDLYSSHFDNPPFTSLAELCFDRQLKEEMFCNRNGAYRGNDIPTQSTGTKWEEWWVNTCPWENWKQRGEHNHDDSERDGKNESKYFEAWAAAYISW